MRQTILQALANYILYFMLYAVIGWLYEVFLEVVVYQWGYSDRGILHGPYCVIYGFGALLLLVTLSRLKERKLYLGAICITPLVIFVAIVLLTTTVELVGSYLMEWLTGSWMWDYTRFRYQFQGRISLSASLRFGIGGMFFLYVLQPLFTRLSDRLRGWPLYLISGSLAVLLLIDTAITFWG